MQKLNAHEIETI